MNPPKSVRIPIANNENLAKLVSEIDRKLFFVGEANAKNADKDKAKKTAEIIAVSELSKNISIEIASIVKLFEENITIADKTYSSESLDVIISTYTKSKLLNIKYKHILTEKNNLYVYDMVAYKSKLEYIEESKLDSLLESEESNKIKLFLLDYIEKNQ